MATLPETVARSLISERFFQNFTAAPIAIVGDGTLAFDPSIQEYLNGSTDSPAGPQPVAATWTVENVRETHGYVQLTVETLEGQTAGLASGDVGGILYQPEILWLIARFAIVTPAGTADAAVEETMRLIRALYERSPLIDSGHADWSTLQVRNRPLNGEGSPWRGILERDVRNGWRNDRLSGEFEVNPILRAVASLAPIEVTLP